MKLSTINKVVEGILESEGLGNNKAARKTLANEACIYLKMAFICENDSLENAMKYYLQPHRDDEFEEFRTFVTTDAPVEYRICWKGEDGSKGVTWAGSQSDALRIKKQYEAKGCEVKIIKEGE